MHRDIKPENLLLDGDVLKLADFGCSSFAAGVRNTYCGTPDYCSPEVLIGYNQCEKVDVWALGVLLFELLTGKSPFAPKGENLSRFAYITRLKENIINNQVEGLDLLSKGARDLFCRLTNKDVKKRLSAPMILKHAWIIFMT